MGNVEDLVLPEERGAKGTDNCHVLNDGTIGCSNGASGCGMGTALQLTHHPSLLATSYTFGKAAGCHGAAVVASSSLVQYLVNYARPFVYSTSLPPHSLVTIGCAYRSMVDGWREGEGRRRVVFGLVKDFRVGLLEWLGNDGGGEDEGEGIGAQKGLHVAKSQ